MDTTDNTAADHVALAAHQQATMFLRGDPKALEGFIIKSYELQKEVAELRATNRKYEDQFLENGSKILQAEARVAAERQRLRDAVNEKINAYEQEMTNPHTSTASYYEAYARQRECTQFLSLLESGSGKEETNKEAK